MDVIINGRFLTQPITGVQRYARELVSALDTILDTTAKFKITVLSPRLSKPAPVWRNIELRQVGHLQGHAWEQLELPWHSRGQLLFCPGNTAPAISLLGSQPVVVTVHDLSYKYFPEAYRPTFRLWYGFLIPLILRRASAVITVSESERNAIIAHYPMASPRLYAIANGGLPPFASEDGTPNLPNGRGGYILYVGSLSKRKNFPRMIGVASRLARERGFHFVFIGDASASLVASTFEIPSDISSRITFVGAVDDLAVLKSYYRKAACLLFPSLYESSGLPPVEAMACGCPVIVSDIPALRERCGVAAIYCNPFDSESIIAAVEKVMDDLPLRERLQAAGYQRSATLTWDSCAGEVLKVICRCIGD